MIQLKSPKEIGTMRVGGEILKRVIDQLIPYIKAGMSTKQIDQEATRLIKASGADISFNKVNGYHWATCLPVNQQIVHTPPSTRVLEDKDVLTIDIGCYYRGFHTDYATTFVLGETGVQIGRFLQAGQAALAKAIAVAARNRYLGEISQAIEKTISGNGYRVIEELTGHGIGRDLHEDPFIPGKLIGPVEKTDKIRPGMVMAIEVIYSEGSAAITYEQDGWSITTADGSLSACFEKTIAVTDKNTIVLT